MNWKTDIENDIFMLKLLLKTKYLFFERKNGIISIFHTNPIFFFRSEIYSRWKMYLIQHLRLGPWYAFYVCWPSILCSPMARSLFWIMPTNYGSCCPNNETKSHQKLSLHSYYHIINKIITVKTFNFMKKHQTYVLDTLFFYDHNNYSEKNTGWYISLIYLFGKKITARKKNCMCKKYPFYYI